MNELILIALIIIYIGATTSSLIALKAYRRMAEDNTKSSATMDERTQALEAMAIELTKERRIIRRDTLLLQKIVKRMGISEEFDLALLKETQQEKGE